MLGIWEIIREGLRQDIVDTSRDYFDDYKGYESTVSNEKKISIINEFGKVTQVRGNQIKVIVHAKEVNLNAYEMAFLWGMYCYTRSSRVGLTPIIDYTGVSEEERSIIFEKIKSIRKRRGSYAGQIKAEGEKLGFDKLYELQWEIKDIQPEFKNAGLFYITITEKLLLNSGNHHL
ncbi:hypothetical protein [Sedimentibacter sp. B4]|uniref:hypothetical protein n=1 Tax=Sedimentibacter sp. B4 TaxID=304766 RepID=UPI00031A71A0|nr:hypothetical protein [Sedimentibacter sp. B4]